MAKRSDKVPSTSIMDVAVGEMTRKGKQDPCAPKTNQGEDTTSLGRRNGAEALATGPLAHRHEGNPPPTGEKDKGPTLGLH